jgi:predicted nucleic acid-binding protein
LIVVDASALSDFLLGRTQALESFESALAGREQEPLHAPELIEPEILNALRRLVATGRVDDRRATEAASDLGKVRLVRYPHAPFRARVWGLRHNLPAYDATYLALAEALDDSMLLTADGGLAEEAARSLGSDRVRRVDRRP